MDNQTISIVISSGIISLIVSFLGITLAIGQYKAKVDEAVKTLTRHNEKIDTLSDRVSKLEGGVERDRANSPYVQRKSPLSLTEKGKALLLDSGGKDYVDAHQSGLLDRLRKRRPKTAYDVQEISRDIIHEHSREDSFNGIKEFAFRQGLKLNDIIDVMGIYFRDIALKEMKLNVADIP